MAERYYETQQYNFKQACFLTPFSLQLVGTCTCAKQLGLSLDQGRGVTAGGPRQELWAQGAQACRGAEPPHGSQRALPGAGAGSGGRSRGGTLQHLHAINLAISAHFLDLHVRKGSVTSAPSNHASCKSRSSCAVQFHCNEEQTMVDVEQGLGWFQAREEVSLKDASWVCYITCAL